MSTAPTQTVLIVEDERKLNETYQKLLRQAGYQVITSYDGLEALEAAAGQDPALILLDVRMPRMNGLEFLQEYDLVTKHPEVKVVVLSNYSVDGEAAEAYRLGVTHYIVKQWASPKELLQIVKNTLAEI